MIFKFSCLNYLETLSVGGTPLGCTKVCTKCGRYTSWLYEVSAVGDVLHRQPCSSALESSGWACSPSLWRPCCWMCSAKCKCSYMAVDTELRMHGTPDVSAILKHAKSAKQGPGTFIYFKEERCDSIRKLNELKRPNEKWSGYFRVRVVGLEKIVSRNMLLETKTSK